MAVPDPDPDAEPTFGCIGNPPPSDTTIRQPWRVGGRRNQLLASCSRSVKTLVRGKPKPEQPGQLLQRALAAVLVSAAVTTLAPVASATPGYGINAVTLARTTLDNRDYILVELTLQPGATTGWHWHNGTLFGAIRRGQLTHYRADCRIDGIYGPGDAITEPSGPENVHIGRNLGLTPVLMQVVYINPIGSPLSVGTRDPGCGLVDTE
ncbi:cupin domain-containing protein [Mycobacterium montefiorense]|uniref:cupin domain-containing protein n=1 Tax=Mycobacterium montefiorense TaxID=154654 RepID=UPI001F402E15|nr:cupin domain-containing protein [Mycobacterium montefiorense]